MSDGRIVQTTHHHEYLPDHVGRKRINLQQASSPVNDRPTTAFTRCSANRSSATIWAATASARDFNTLRAAGNNVPWGIWSDGETLWVAGFADGKIYAYHMTTKARAADKEFDTLRAAGNNDPTGIWSDGTTMWVADLRDARIYAYNMPAASAGDAATDRAALVAFYNATGGANWGNNGNGKIEKKKVIEAIKDYLFGEGDEAISKGDVIKLIKLYLFGRFEGCPGHSTGQEGRAPLVSTADDAAAGAYPQGSGAGLDVDHHLRRLRGFGSSHGNAARRVRLRIQRP